MLLLNARFDPHRLERGSSLRLAYLLAVVPALALAGIGWAREMGGGPLAALGHALASAGVHSGFVTLGWVVALDGRPGWQAPALRFTVALVVASVASRIDPLGALLYLLPLGFLLHDGLGQRALRAIGLDWPSDIRAIVVGLAAGGFLGIHLLISASMTFGYGIRIQSASAYLAAVAYDVGANAVSAEWLFQGTLFSRWWRRWRFWPAAALSTLLLVGRYLFDPILPHTLEVWAGTVFYMGLLGFTACALRAWSGSLLPGYLATVAFFAAYRTLAP